jgi:NAD(P)-dependent dehydrogenase (short-subunit alcohol dehydrogenase family)
MPVAIVTGSDSGIGKATAAKLAERGFDIGITWRSKEDGADETKREVESHGRRAAVRHADFADVRRGGAVVAELADELGGIDVLVNNAGIPKRRRVPDLTPDVVESVMAINYFSPIRLTLALLPGIEQRGGRIVNISSVAARLGPPAEAAYSASKAALTAWSESMQVDLGIAGSPVRVHVVNPGVFDTELFHLPDNDAFTAQVEMLPVESIVEPILHAITNDLFELYVPEWFGDVAAGKAKDVGTFLAGSIAYLKAEQDKASA